MAGLMDFSWPNERKTVPTPTAYLKKISTQTNGQIWLMQRQIFEDAYNYWDILKKTPTAVQLLGMHEYDWETTTAYNTLFSEPINLFRLPVVPQTWSGTSSFVVDQIPFDVVYNNEILEGTFDITLVTTDPPVIEKGNSWIRKHLNKRSSDRLEIVWFGCRKILSNTVISFTNRTTQSITETYWQAPGVGEIRYMTTEIQYLDPLDPSIFQTFNMDVYRMPLAISRKRKLN